MIFQGQNPWEYNTLNHSPRRLTMPLNESNTEPYELKNFSRKLDPENHLKDRLIIRHLRRRKNNFLLDFDEPTSRLKDFGANHE
jgi:hypothetical protein